MYVRQVIGSIIAGSLLAVVGLSAGLNLVSAVAVGGLAALSVKVIWATAGRTRYWLSRGTRGVYTEKCPNCHRARHRISGDWILQCRKCGWKPGWPVVRWLTRSVPAIQFRRSVSRLEGAAALLLGSILVLSLQGSFAVSEPQLDLHSLPTLDQIVASVLVVVVIVVMLIYALFYRKVYCRNCGQYLGRGSPPDVCEKCGSNRFTHQDPGVGKKVRVENVDK